MSNLQLQSIFQQVSCLGSSRVTKQHNFVKTFETLNCRVVHSISIFGQLPFKINICDQCDQGYTLRYPYDILDWCYASSAFYSLFSGYDPMDVSYGWRLINSGRSVSNREMELDQSSQTFPLLHSYICYYIMPAFFGLQMAQ